MNTFKSTTYMLLVSLGLIGCPQATSPTDDLGTDTDIEKDDPCTTPGIPIRDRDMEECPDRVEQPFIVFISEVDCLLPANEFSIQAEVIGLVEKPQLELVGIHLGRSLVEQHTDVQLSQGGFPVENTDVYISLRMDDTSFINGSTSELPCDGTQWALGLRSDAGNLLGCYRLTGAWKAPELAPPDYVDCMPWPPR